MAETATPSSKSRKITALDITLIALLIVLLVVAAVGVVSCKREQVPGDAAAKVNDTYITETEVNQYIEYYRSSNSLDDDAQWAAYLMSNNDTPYSFRQEYLEAAAQNLVIDERAKELDLVPSDEEVEEQLEEMKSSSSFDSDEVWQETLESTGTDEETIKAQISTNLAKQKLFKKEVKEITATDDQTLSYTKSSEAGVSVKHSYHIIINPGDETVYTISEKVESLLKKAASNGTLDAAYFQKLAKKYSDDESVAEDSGDYGWTQISESSDDDDDYLATLRSLKKGEFSDAVNATDGGLEIVYCDDTYTFPDSDKISDLTQKDVPTSLWASLKDSAGASLYDTACDAYLANLYSQASITFYPIPEGASYNVDMNLSVDVMTSTSSSSNE